MSQEKCTIQAAAKALGVTTKTVYRYLSNGTLSRIREGTRTYILIDEVRTLRGKLSVTQENGVLTSCDNGDNKKITLKLTEYNELLKKIGQAEGQERYLLEYRANLQVKEKELATVKDALAANSSELDQARAVISRARSELQKLAEIKKESERDRAELEILRAENERLRVPWWKKLFPKK